MMRPDRAEEDIDRQRHKQTSSRGRWRSNTLLMTILSVNESYASLKFSSDCATHLGLL